MTFESGTGDGDEEHFQPPLPPEDRIWRHPSELPRTDSPTTPDNAHLDPMVAGAGRGRAGLAIASATVGAVVMVGVLLATGMLERDPATPRVVELVAATPENDQPVAGAALPAVVRIEAAQPDQDLVGAGILLRSDGHIVTTATLTDSVESVDVVLHGGSRLTGTVVGRDPLTDVGVVRIEAADAEPILLGSAGDLEAGERIVAVSAPDLGPETRITEGVVTALGVTVDHDEPEPLHAMIATSPAMAGLSPGTPIFDQRGALVGIISIEVAGSGDHVEGGSSTTVSVDTAGPHATPVETARIVAADIIETGEARHPWLGVSVRPDESDDSAVVSAVAADSPADEAGLQTGDRITSIAGVDVADVSGLVTELRLYHPGDTVKISYERDGAARSCEPALEQWQADSD